MGDAVAVEVGTERSVRGIARRIRIAQPHESSIAGSSEHAALEYTELPLPNDGACAIQVGKRLTASILYAHPYLLSDRTQAHASIPVVAQLRQTLESLGIPLPHDRTPVQRVGCKPVARTEMSDPSAVDRATRASTSPTTCDVDGIGSPLNGDDRSGSVGTAAGTASRTLRSDGNCNGTDGMVSTAHDDFDVNATQTDRMWQLCDTMLSHCIEDLLDSHPTVSHILLLATAELRDRLGLLQLHCGTITSEHLSAVAEFVQVGGLIGICFRVGVRRGTIFVELPPTVYVCASFSRTPAPSNPNSESTHCFDSTRWNYTAPSSILTTGVT